MRYERQGRGRKRGGREAGGGGGGGGKTSRIFVAFLEASLTAVALSAWRVMIGARVRVVAVVVAATDKIDLKLGGRFCSSRNVTRKRAARGTNRLLPKV